MTGTAPPSSPSSSTGGNATQPRGLVEPLFSGSELSVLARRLTWQQRAALRVIARTPSRVRQRDDGRFCVDTQSSSRIAIATWLALERKGLAYRDAIAHPASLVGQRLALTPKGLAVLNHVSNVIFPSSATRLWPRALPPQFTARPAQKASTLHGRHR